MSKGKITPQYLDELKKRVDEQEAQFFKELSEKGDWNPCKSKDHAKLYYKDDSKSGIKKMKINAVIPCRMQCLIDALLVAKNRISWEVVINGMKQIEEFGDGYAMHHITTKSIGFVVGKRDFVHLRRIRGPEGIDKKDEKQTDARVVIDISAEHPDYPANKNGFTRGQTLFCATIFREFQKENGEYYTTYDTITQSNINGYVPSWLVNTVTSSSTMEWYEGLEKCALKLHKEQNK
ncbi:START domain-containing protein [Entamoeba marina]